MAIFQVEQYGALEDLKDLQDYIRRQLLALARAINEISEVQLEELHTAPQYPQNGKLYFADGTDWDPGAGRGFYGYDTTGPTWRKLG